MSIIFRVKGKETLIMPDSPLLTPISLFMRAVLPINYSGQGHSVFIPLLYRSDVIEVL